MTTGAPVELLTHAGCLLCGPPCKRVQSALDDLVDKTSAVGGMSGDSIGLGSSVVFTVTQGASSAQSSLHSEIFPAATRILKSFSGCAVNIVDPEKPTKPATSTRLVDAFIKHKHPLWWYNTAYLVMQWIDGPDDNSHKGQFCLEVPCYFYKCLAQAMTILSFDCRSALVLQNSTQSCINTVFSDTTRVFGTSE